MKRSIFTFFLFIPVFIFSQSNNQLTSNLQLPTSINESGNAPDNSAILDVQSSSRGVLFPRMSYTQIKSISNPEIGLMVYDTEYNCLRLYNGTNWDCLYELKNPDQPKNGNLSAISLTNPGYSDARAMDIDNQGNVILAADLDDTDEFYLAKLNQSGGVIWDQTNQSYKIEDVAIDNSNNVLIAAENRDVSNGVPFNALIIKKYTPAGNLLWQVTEGQANGIYVNSIEVGVTGDFNVLVEMPSFTNSTTISGVTFSNANGSDPNISSHILVRYSSSGSFLWAKQLKNVSNVKIETAGNTFLYVSGNYENSFSFGAGNLFSCSSNTCGFMLNVQNSGVLWWNENLSSSADFEIEDINSDVSGNLIFAIDAKSTISFSNLNKNINGSGIQFGKIESFLSNIDNGRVPITDTRYIHISENNDGEIYLSFKTNSSPTNLGNTTINGNSYILMNMDDYNGSNYNWLETYQNNGYVAEMEADDVNDNIYIYTQYLDRTVIGNQCFNPDLLDLLLIKYTE